MSNQILTIEEVAKTMKVSLKTVYRWISGGDLAAARIGYKTYRVFEADLIRFLRKNMARSRRRRR
jgi:excisionase family DNA binding protein